VRLHVDVRLARARTETTTYMMTSQRSQLELEVLRERLKEEEAAAALLADSKQKLVDELEVRVFNAMQHVVLADSKCAEFNAKSV
jgi:hypothetical protein